VLWYCLFHRVVFVWNIFVLELQDLETRNRVTAINWLQADCRYCYFWHATYCTLALGLESWKFLYRDIVTKSATISWYCRRVAGQFKAPACLPLMLLGLYSLCQSSATISSYWDVCNDIVGHDQTIRALTRINKCINCRSFAGRNYCSLSQSVCLWVTQQVNSGQMLTFVVQSKSVRVACEMLPTASDRACLMSSRLSDTASDTNCW